MQAFSFKGCLTNWQKARTKCRIVSISVCHYNLDNKGMHFTCSRHQVMLCFHVNWQYKFTFKSFIHKRIGKAARTVSPRFSALSLRVMQSKAGFINKNGKLTTLSEPAVKSRPTSLLLMQLVSEFSLWWRLPSSPAYLRLFSCLRVLYSWT